MEVKVVGNILVILLKKKRRKQLLPICFTILNLQSDNFIPSIPTSYFRSPQKEEWLTTYDKNCWLTIYMNISFLIEQYHI